MTTLRRTAPALAVATVLALSGCGGEDSDPGGSDSPSATQSAEPSKTTKDKSKKDEPSESPALASVDVSIQGDSVSPMAQQVELGVGEPLELVVTSDRDGEFHVHSNPEQTPAFAAGTSRVRLLFDKPGQVDVEEHESGALVLRILVK